MTGAMSNISKAKCVCDSFGNIFSINNLSASWLKKKVLWEFFVGRGGRDAELRTVSNRNSCFMDALWKM